MSKKRNKIGDVEILKIGEEFWRNQNERRWTHLFHFKDSRAIFLPVDFDGMPRKEIKNILPKFNLITVEMFKSPEAQPWDEWMCSMTHPHR